MIPVNDLLAGCISKIVTLMTPKPQLPSPVENGWEVKEDEGLTPVLAKQSAAPREILELTICRCRTSECSKWRNCKCVANGLNCTSACTCSDSNDTTGEEDI